MAKVKLLRTALVSGNAVADAAGTVVEVDDQRARELIQSGIAEDAGNAKATAQGFDSEAHALRTREEVLRNMPTLENRMAPDDRANRATATTGTAGATGGTDGGTDGGEDGGTRRARTSR